LLNAPATTLSAITYHLLANPEKFARLKSELNSAIPDASIPPTCAQVECLPYLSAVIQEGMRLHPGATLRMQRVSPIDDLIYTDHAQNNWIIPAGTPVSMTPTLIQTVPKYFPSPNEFRPERWIENPRLAKYLLAFSKGSRMCLGYGSAPLPHHKFAYYHGEMRLYKLTTSCAVLTWRTKSSISFWRQFSGNTTCTITWLSAGKVPRWRCMTH
jgi:cytochrome P450